MGYHRAGFDVVGVDIEPQKRYPFKFILADAMDISLKGYDAIHASPPCQGYSNMRHLPWLKHKTYPLLIDACRARLIASGVPWVLENVLGSKIGGIVLCGLFFGLNLYRHRRFESSELLWEPEHLRHVLPAESNRKSWSDRACRLAPRLIKSRSDGVVLVAGHQGSAKKYREAMGIDWMIRDELSQAIPPSYTEFIGKQMMAILDNIRNGI